MSQAIEIVRESVLRADELLAAALDLLGEAADLVRTAGSRTGQVLALGDGSRADARDALHRVEAEVDAAGRAARDARRRAAPLVRAAKDASQLAECY